LEIVEQMRVVGATLEGACRDLDIRPKNLVNAKPFVFPARRRQQRNSVSITANDDTRFQSLRFLGFKVGEEGSSELKRNDVLLNLL
jgi:hypothetical protein